MNRMSSEVSGLHDEGGDIPQAAESGLPAENSAGAAGAGASADEQVRWLCAYLASCIAALAFFHTLPACLPFFCTPLLAFS
jgi:hypothetical protein